MFVGVHAMLAMNTGIPEFELSPDEGVAFTQAAQNVMRHYSVETTQKTLDWIAFMGTVGGIYGPRIVAYGVRRQHEKQQQRMTGGPVRFRPTSADVVNLHPSVPEGPVHDDGNGE